MAEAAVAFASLRRRPLVCTLPRCGSATAAALVGETIPGALQVQAQVSAQSASITGIASAKAIQLENHSNSTFYPAAQEGMLIYDSTRKQLLVFDGA